MSDRAREARAPEIRGRDALSESGSFPLPVQDPAKILVVDPDPFLQEMIEAGFRIFNPAFSILKADNPETALLVLRRHEIDIALTEFDFPEAQRDGSTFLGDLRDFSPHLPVIVITEADADSMKGMHNVCAIVSKPPDMDYLLRKVNQMLQENRESVIRGISLESFLQILEVERKTCTLTVTSGQNVGRMYIHAGELIHAETERFESKAAAFAMLSWPDYQIKIIEKCDAKPTIAERLNAILMEYCVQKDHGLI